MRAKSLIGCVVVAAAVAGCSNDGDAATGNAATNSALANYRPPTITSRADYGGLTERRFQRMDANGDGKLSSTELPPRINERAVARYDANGDKQLDSVEWGKMMLERFDRQDGNKDGTVTTEERDAFRAQRGEAGGDDRAARLERRAERERARAAE